MIFVVILKIISVLLAIVGTTYLIPVITAISFKEFSYIIYFLIPMIFSWILCLSVYASTKKIKIQLKISKRLFYFGGRFNRPIADESALRFSFSHKKIPWELAQGIYITRSFRFQTQQQSYRPRNRTADPSSQHR